MTEWQILPDDSSSEFSEFEDSEYLDVVSPDNCNQHYHHCPTCYNSFECDFDCTLEPDLKEGDREYGSYCNCYDCSLLDNSKIEMYSPRWFDQYNGIK